MTAEGGCISPYRDFDTVSSTSKMRSGVGRTASFISTTGSNYRFVPKISYVNDVNMFFRVSTYIMGVRYCVRAYLSVIQKQNYHNFGQKSNFLIFLRYNALKF